MKKLLFSSFQGSLWSYEIATGAIRPATVESGMPSSLEEDKRFFSDINRVKMDDLYHPQEDINPEKFVAEAFLTLSVTEECSNRCSYCIFGGRYPEERCHSERVMLLRDAIRAVDDFCGDVGNVVRNFSFYGGEPMFRQGFDVVKGVVEYIKHNYADGINNFTLTTNGNHFTEETIKFLIDNDLHIGVSLDGPREVHDRNRHTRAGEATFDHVMKGLSKIQATNADYYRKNVRFICVLNPPLDYKCIRDFFGSNALTRDNDIMVSNVALFGQSYYSDAEVASFSRATIQMVREAAQTLYKAVRQHSLSSCTFERGLFLKELMILRSRNLQQSHDHLDLLGRCLPGRFKRFLATDGTYYICEKMQGAYPIGTLESGIDVERVYKMVKSHELLIENKCPSCPYAKICTLCYVAACGDKHMFSAGRLEENCIERRSFAKLLLRLYASFIEELGEDGFNRLLDGQWVDG